MSSWRVDSIFHNNPVSYVWFVPSLLTLSSILKVLLLSWHVNFLFVEFSFWAAENAKNKKKKKKSKKWIKTRAPMFKATIFDFNICYFSWLHICVSNEISALHNLIKSLFREGLNIYKSSGFRVCALSLWKKRRKNGANKAIRQGNRDLMEIS